MNEKNERKKMQEIRLIWLWYFSMQGTTQSGISQVEHQ